MPSNIRKVIRSKKKESSELMLHLQAQYQQRVVTALLKYLAILTPVKTGLLAGGWMVFSRKSKNIAPESIPVNSSHLISAQNRSRIAKISGKGSVVIQNDVYYGKFQNDGWVHNPTPKKFGFILLAKRLAIADLAAAGLPEAAKAVAKVNIHY